MTYYEKVLFLSVVVNIASFLNHVSAHKFEAVIGGHLVEDDSLQYQVSVQYQRKPSGSYFPICGGGSIADYFIISAAHCFFKDYNNLKNVAFSIVVDSLNLESSDGFRIQIEIIYLFEFDAYTFFNDIAVAKLKNKLSIYINIRKLDLPDELELFSHRTGTAAGYGYNTVRIEVKPEAGKTVRVGESDGRLRYASVNVLDTSSCQNNYPHVTTSQHMCGAMIPNVPGDHWGLCKGDSGSPLVINNAVAGIAISSPLNCNDTEKGCIYSRVSTYVNEIQTVLDGREGTSEFIYQYFPIQYVIAQ